jgi:hypothetical protein
MHLRNSKIRGQDLEISIILIILNLLVIAKLASKFKCKSLDCETCSNKSPPLQTHTKTECLSEGIIIRCSCWQMTCVIIVD